MRVHLLSSSSSCILLLRPRSPLSWGPRVRLLTSPQCGDYTKKDQHSPGRLLPFIPAYGLVLAWSWPGMLIDRWSNEWNEKRRAVYAPRQLIKMNFNLQFCDWTVNELPVQRAALVLPDASYSQRERTNERTTEPSACDNYDPIWPFWLLFRHFVDRRPHR